MHPTTPNANDILTRIADAIGVEADRLACGGYEPAMLLAESLENIAATIRDTAPPLPEPAANVIHLASPADWAALTGLCGSRTGPFTLSQRQATCEKCLRENDHGEYSHGYQGAGDY